MTFLGWLVCMLLGGHVYSDWARVTWVQTTYSWLDSWPVNSTNAATESRFCLRCHTGYEQRWAS